MHSQQSKGTDEMRIARMLCSVFAVLVTTVHAAEPAASTSSAMTPGTRLSGYLQASEMLSSATLLPVPPATDSAAMARDQEGNHRALELHGTPRWTMASQDAVLSFPAIAETFACALNAPISEERTPRLMQLLRRTLVDAGRSTSEAKKRYQRPRPFMVNGKPICTPTREDALRADGSYPSGHAAIGWAFGLVLAEVAPEQAQSLIARGRAFGMSRVVCNVHWPSDVLEGQMMASAVVARLHAEPEFRSDVEAARAEMVALQSQTGSVPRDCKLESQTLASAQ
jgi:acid phosphatase (class A)